MREGNLLFNVLSTVRDLGYINDHTSQMNVFYHTTLDDITHSTYCHHAVSDNPH